jgi:hypothetical protein
MSYFKKEEPQSPTGFNLFQGHHYYWGMILIAFGFYGIFDWRISMTIVELSLVIGFWLVIDDLIQHIIQRREIKKTGVYVTISFWNWFPRLLWRKIWGRQNKQLSGG